MKKLIIAAAALALTVPLAGCYDGDYEAGYNPPYPYDSGYYHPYGGVYRHPYYDEYGSYNGAWRY